MRAVSPPSHLERLASLIRGSSITVVSSRAAVAMTINLVRIFIILSYSKGWLIQTSWE